MYYGLQVKFLCGKTWEAVFEVKTHLVAEYAYCTGACAVIFFCAFCENALQKVEVLFHYIIVYLLKVGRNAFIILQIYRFVSKKPIVWTVFSFRLIKLLIIV